MQISELCWGVSAHSESMGEVLEIIQNFPFVKHVQLKLPGEPDQSKHSARIKRAAQAAAQQGFALSVHAEPHINLCENLPTLAKANLALAQAALRACYDIGGQFALFHGGSVQGRGNPQLLRRRGMAALAQSLENLLEYAAEYNIPVHLENIYPAPFRSELVRLPSRREDFSSLMDMLDSPFLKFCYDYGHGMIDSPSGEMPSLKVLGSLHLHENDCLNDLHLPIGAADHSPIIWPNELKKLAAADFSGAVILENPPDGLKEALKTVEIIIQHGGELL
ncbi:MAG: TIM barrel protein [Christensenellaceae bacterium]|nr:TIM barrel protein [Christensenellaceae bacterium]